MSDDLKCPHCGKVAQDDWALDVFHRGCRLSALFPEARTELGGGLVSFDVPKIMEKLGMGTKGDSDPRIDPEPGDGRLPSPRKGGKRTGKADFERH